MNRRSFFTKAALFVAECQLAFNVIIGIKKLRINPAWTNAIYEVVFLIDNEVYQEPAWAFPVRMNEPDLNAPKINPFIID